MSEKDCYLLTEVAEIIRCSIDDLLETADLNGIEIGIKPDPEWYFWKREDNSHLTHAPVQNAGFINLFTEEDFQKIMTEGFAKIDFFEEGYLSTNPKFKYGGVIVTKEHLALSKEDFIDFTEPSSHEEICKLQKADNAIDPTIPSFEITQTERNSMLKLIIGMAIDAYGYDPQAARNKATGENRGSIKVALESRGISIDADTIRKYLDEAKDLLPPQA